MPFDLFDRHGLVGFPGLCNVGRGGARQHAHVHVCTHICAKIHESTHMQSIEKQIYKLA